jgi:hypothetical protein
VIWCRYTTWAVDLRTSSKTLVGLTHQALQEAGKMCDKFDSVLPLPAPFCDAGPLAVNTSNWCNASANSIYTNFSQAAAAIKEAEEAAHNLNSSIIDQLPGLCPPPMPTPACKALKNALTVALQQQLAGNSVFALMVQGLSSHTPDPHLVRGVVSNTTMLCATLRKLGQNKAALDRVTTIANFVADRISQSVTSTTVAWCFAHALAFICSIWISVRAIYRYRDVQKMIRRGRGDGLGEGRPFNPSTYTLPMANKFIGLHFGSVLFGYVIVFGFLFLLFTILFNPNTYTVLWYWKVGRLCCGCRDLVLPRSALTCWFLERTKLMICFDGLFSFIPGWHNPGGNLHHVLPHLRAGQVHRGQVVVRRLFHPAPAAVDLVHERGGHVGGGHRHRCLHQTLRFPHGMCGMCSVCGMWCVVCGMWCVQCGVWHVC